MIIRQALILDNRMAMSKKGFRFVPTDEILVQYLFEKIHHGFDDTHEVPLFEYDLYGSEEPSDVWEKFAGNRFEEGNSNEDLYFFTKLKKMSVTGSRINRAVGSGGTWSAAYSREFSTRSTIIHGAPVIMAKKTHLRYENEGSLNHGAWIMHEFCLGYMDDSNHFCRYDDPYVICRLRKSRKGRNQKKLGLKSLGDRDHQPNVITKKPRLLEQGCNEEGCFEYSRMGSTNSGQPQIDEVLEARNKSNSLSEFKSCVHGINGSSASLCEDVVGINIENDQVVVEERHSNPCTTTDESVLTTSTETPMSFDDVFQYDGREKCSNLDEDMSPIDADWILKYLLEDCDDGISTENNHVVAEEHCSPCTTTDEGVLTNPMSLDVDVFQFDNLCAWDDYQIYNAHSVQDQDDQTNVITKKAELCEPGYEEGVEYSRIGSKSTTVLPQIDQDFEARNLSNKSSEFTTSIQGIDVVIIQNDPDVVEAEAPISLDGNAFQYDNLCAREKCTNLDEGVSSTDADGMLKYLLEDDDGINIENDHVVVEEQSTSCTTVDQGVLTNSTSAVTPMSFDIDEFQFDNLGASNDQIFPDEADEALKYFEEDHHVAVDGGNELTPIITD